MRYSKPKLGRMARFESRAALALVALLPPLAGCGSKQASRGLLGPGDSLVRVNEIQSSGNSELPETDIPGEYPDWIELYNGGHHDANLEGYFITDNPEKPFKQALLPGVVVPARGYLVLWADNLAPAVLDGLADPQLHLGFRLSGAGESVELRDPDGNLVDRVDFGPVSWSLTQVPDSGTSEGTCLSQDYACPHSYARFPDGSGAFSWCSPPTPEVSNGDACTWNGK